MPTFLQNHTTPEDQGRIFFMLAHIYAQSGGVRPELAIKWAKKALEYPLDPKSKQLAYVYWGDSVQLSHRGVQGEQLAVVRREAVLPYLQGLKDLLACDLPEVPSEPSNVEAFIWTGSKDDPGYEKRLRAYKAHEDASNRMRFVSSMIRYRDVYTAQIAYMYSRLPFATGELESLAKDVLKDTVAADRLLARVRGGWHGQSDSFWVAGGMAKAILSGCHVHGLLPWRGHVFGVHQGVDGRSD